MAASSPHFTTRPAWDGGETPRADRFTVVSPSTIAEASAAGRGTLSLVRTVEAEIIPRLLLAGRVAVPRPIAAAPGSVPLGAQEVVELAELVLVRDADVAASYVEGLRARGQPIESLYLDLLAPTARHLGNLWVEDICSFADVTVALCRLHQVLFEVTPTFERASEWRAHGRRALLVPVPGEQHSFGLTMVAEFFRHDGWDVWSGPELSSTDLVKTVAKDWFAVVGLSVASERRLDAASAAVRAVRRASRNRTVGVMVGGPVFLEHPEFVALVGADTTAVDGRHAVLQAHHLMTLLPSGT